MLRNANHILAVSIVPESSSIGLPAEEAERPRQPRKLRRWSDVIFLEYGRGWIKNEFGRQMPTFLDPVSANPTIIKPIPNWILLHDVGRANDVMAMAGLCLQIMYRQPLQAWPGITFPVGSLCYFYLLGTETSAEVAMFFIRHRKITDVAALGAVTIFQDANGKMNLLWWATNQAADLRGLRIAAEANGAKDRTAHTANMWDTAWPFPMRPVRV